MKSVGRKLHEGPGVTIKYDPVDDAVTLELTGLAARRLILALGLNTKRYGPEVSALLAGLCKLLLGVPTEAIEQSHPHGPGCSCPHCGETFQ